MKVLLFVCGSLLLFTTSALSGCTTDRQEEILVFAAASTTDVMQRLGDVFSRQHQVKVSFNFGGSTALSSQIIRGAPADAFIAAGQQPMGELKQRGLLESGSRIALLTNDLVIVMPASGASPAANTVELLNQAKRIVIADPALAPAGGYTQVALMNMGLWDKLLPKLVYGADVRTTLGYVESGNVDAAIVYATDVRGAKGLRIMASIPSNLYPTILYPGAVLKNSAHKETAQAFLTFLGSAQAADIFREYGFTPVP